MIQQDKHTWFDAPVVIDGANVAGSERLPACGKFCWDRVDEVKRAWLEQMDPTATFVVFMDSASARQLGPSCAKRYRTERDSGQVEEVAFADPEILRIAEQADAAVITEDFFKDKRREHPWLDGNRNRFFAWGVEHGHVIIVPRDMGTPSDFSKTRAEQRAELKGMGADITKPAVEGALKLAYRCDTATCWLHKYDPGHYTGIPDLANPQQPRCTVCRQVLSVLGEAPRLVQLKFADAARSKLERRTFPPGTSFIIGRDASNDLITGVLDADLSLISRQHARLDWDGSELSITDLGSKNGTAVRRWAGKQRGYAAAESITGTVTLRSRDEVCLAGSLLITRSARTFTLEPDVLSVNATGSSQRTVAQGGRGR